MRRRYRGRSSYNAASYAASAQEARRAHYANMAPHEAAIALARLEKQQREIDQEKERGFPDEKRLELAAKNHARYLTQAEEEKNAPPRYLGLFRSSASKQEEAQLRGLAAESLNVMRSLETAKRAWNADISHRAKKLSYELSAARQVVRKSIAETERIDRERRIAQQEADRKERDKQQREIMTARVAAADRLSRELGQRVRTRITRGPDCPYCGRLLKEPECDHIIPVAKGGLSTPGNMVFVCRPCNQAKSDKTLRQFCKSFGYDYMKILHRLEQDGKDV